VIFPLFCRLKNSIAASHLLFWTCVIIVRMLREHMAVSGSGTEIDSGRRGRAVPAIGDGNMPSLPANVEANHE
jgi:hypothetical protein